MNIHAPFFISDKNTTGQYSTFKQIPICSLLFLIFQSFSYNMWRGKQSHDPQHNIIANLSPMEQKITMFYLFSLSPSSFIAYRCYKQATSMRALSFFFPKYSPKLS